MIDIKSKIMETLSPLEGIDVCFLERDDDGVFPFIVYNVSEVPYSFSDDEEDITLYLVTINIFSKPDYNFEYLKLRIIELMKNNGFRKTEIPGAKFMEQENVYNQPMGFSYFVDLTN